MHKLELNNNKDILSSTFELTVKQTVKRQIKIDKGHHTIVRHRFDFL